MLGLYFSERIGYIPEEESMSSEFVDQYQIVVGLSVTEMEIVHAAYKNCNPNGQLPNLLLFSIVHDDVTYKPVSI